MGKLVAYLFLIRPSNCLMMGFAVIVGAALASPQSLDPFPPNLLYGFMTGFALTASSMVLNDYFDREIDAVNEPDRPIPSGKVSSLEAVGLAIVLTTIGLIISSLTNLFSFFMASFVWMVSVAYVTIGKSTGLLGNLLVSTCVATPFLYGSAVMTNEAKLNVLLFASIAFLANTGREITKGIVDVEGDAMQGVKTLAIQYGERKAAFSAAIFYIIAVLLSPIPYVLNLVSLWFVPTVVITDLGLVSSSAMLLKNHSRKNARKIKTLVLLWFMIGLIAFILGVIK